MGDDERVVNTASFTWRKLDSSGRGTYRRCRWHLQNCTNHQMLSLHTIPKLIAGQDTLCASCELLQWLSETPYSKFSR